MSNGIKHIRNILNHNNLRSNNFFMQLDVDWFLALRVFFAHKIAKHGNILLFCRFFLLIMYDNSQCWNIENITSKNANDLSKIIGLYVKWVFKALASHITFGSNRVAHSGDKCSKTIICHLKHIVLGLYIT